MKILITGGAGFIGSNLTAHLNAAEPTWSLRVLDDLSTGRLENLMSTVCDLRIGSILDPRALTAAMEGIDAVVHLAALGSVPRSVAAPVPTHEVNAGGTLAVLEAARAAGVDQVIVASSSSVYGDNPSLPKRETDWTSPLSPYGVSKLAAEAYALAFQHSYGMQTLAFRFFNVFGAKQSAGHVYAAVLPRFIQAALDGERLVVHGDGLQSRDFTHVSTVTRTLHAALRDRVTSDRPVNLAHGTSTTLLQLVELLESECGRSLLTQHAPPRVGDVRASQADGIRIRQLFPDLEPTGLVEGLHDTFAWFAGRSDSACVTPSLLARGT